MRGNVYPNTQEFSYLSHAYAALAASIDILQDAVVFIYCVHTIVFMSSIEIHLYIVLLFIYIICIQFAHDLLYTLYVYIVVIFSSEAILVSFEHMGSIEHSNVCSTVFRHIFPYREAI